MEKVRSLVFGLYKMWLYNVVLFVLICVVFVVGIIIGLMVFLIGCKGVQEVYCILYVIVWEMKIVVDFGCVFLKEFQVFMVEWNQFLCFINEKMVNVFRYRINFFIRKMLRVNSEVVR